MKNHLMLLTLILSLLLQACGPNESELRAELQAIDHEMVMLRNATYRHQAETSQAKSAALMGGFEAEVSISPNLDSRGPGWVLYSYDDAPRVDFSRIRDQHDVTFAHANGFIAKVKEDATIMRLVALVSAAATEAGEA